MHALMREMERSLDSYLGTGMEWLDAWQDKNRPSDAKQMARWNEYVKEIYHLNPRLCDLDTTFHQIDQVSLFDPEHKEYFEPLRQSNEENCRTWASRNGRGTSFVKTHDKNPYYPMTYCKNSMDNVIGFDFLGSFVNPHKNVDQEDWMPQYPTMYDPYGTLPFYYSQSVPVMAFAPTIHRFKSKHIDYTLICKGFKEFNENNEPPHIPRLEPDRDGELGLQSHDSADQEPPQPPSINMESDEYGEDKPEIPNPLDPAQLKKTAETEINWETSDQYQEQIWYLTGRNLNKYILAVMDSALFNTAATKTRYSDDVTVRRICVWIYLKAHVVLLCWDTMLNEEKRPFCHRIYICNNVPQDNFLYKDEFHGSKCNDEILSHFYEGLRLRGHIGRDAVPVEIFNDTAFRATFRRNFLLDEFYGGDLACNAYVTLCALYLAQVVDVVQVLENGSTREWFATRDTKRLYRFEMKCFDLHLRKFLMTEIIRKKNAVMMSPKLAHAVVGMDDIFLLSATPGESKPKIYTYAGALSGFISKTTTYSKRSMPFK